MTHVKVAISRVFTNFRLLLSLNFSFRWSDAISVVASGWVIWGAVSVKAAAAAPPVFNTHDFAGIYVYLNEVPANSPWNDVYAEAIAQPYVDGAAIVVKWSSIEPAHNVYDWSVLQRWVVKAVGLHKKLAIGIEAGAWTPGWLYQAGVPDNVFAKYDRSPPLGLCGPLHQPSVWDPRYLQAYGEALAQLSAYLHGLNIPGRPPGAAYAALRIVKLAGINLTTEELRIDAHPPGGPCGEPDSAAMWLQAGYRPEKVLDAWMSIATMTARVFPDKMFSVAVIHKGAFPPIDDDGTIDSAAVTMPVAPDPMLVRILGAAVPRFGGQLLVQWNALSQFAHPNGGAVLPREVLDAGAAGARIGWQLNGFMGVWGGSGCIYPPFHITACRTIADFQAMLDSGIDHGGSYIEIHPVTVDSRFLRLPDGALRNFGPAYEEAHDRLANLRP